MIIGANDMSNDNVIDTIERIYGRSIKKYVISCVKCEFNLMVTPTIKGYVIKFKSCVSYRDVYMFFIYVKIPGKEILVKSSQTYFSLDICQTELKKYMRYFPLYGFASRHVFKSC